MKLKLIAILALIGGPILAIGSYNDKKEFDKIKADGVEVPGILESGESKRSRKGITTYKFDVAWKTKDGREIRRNMTLPGSFVKPRLSGDAIVNDAVTVRYLPSDPTKAYVVGGEKDPKEMIFVGSGVGLAGLVGTTVMLRKKRTV